MVNRTYHTIIWGTVCGVLILPNIALAADGRLAGGSGQAQYSQYLAQTAGMNQKVMASAQAFQPQSELPNYQANPKASQFYPGERGSDDAMRKAANQAAGESGTTAHTVMHDFLTRPVYHISDKSPGIEKSQLIQSDSHNIAHGISDKYVDCKQATQCTTTYISKTCDEGTRALTRSCTKTPKVTVTKTPYIVTEHFSGNITATSSNGGELILREPGKITAFSVVLKSGNVWTCHQNYKSYLNGQYVSTSNWSCGHWLGDLSFQNAHLNVPIQANQPIQFTFNGPSRGLWQWAHYQLTLSVTHYHKKATVIWQEVCHDTN